MEYSSAAQTKMGLDIKSYLSFVPQGCIVSGIKIGSFRANPANAKKPADARIKSGRYIGQHTNKNDEVIHQIK